MSSTLPTSNTPSPSTPVSPRNTHGAHGESTPTMLISQPAPPRPSSADAQIAARSGLESASRLISETAHDLRAPLTSIRESVRLVRDGDLGPISSDQRECLSLAMDQCNCISQLVDEMVQSRQQVSGIAGARRQWVSIDDIRQDVESTMAPWTLPRGIQLLWDGPFGTGVRTYADPVLLRRLIVNLLSNAVRVTLDGQPILVRSQMHPRRGLMAWSIVDQGRGIEASDMERIAAGKAPAHSSGGLGLLISRQLAAAQFSRLKIESRVGTGTAVSFVTPAGGPVAVAQRWSRWRSDLMIRPDATLIGATQMIHDAAAGRSVGRSDAITPPRRVRIDVPSQRLELSIADFAPDFSDQVYVNTVAVGAAVPMQRENAFGDLLYRSMQMSELAYRVGRRQWVIAWDADRSTGTVKQNELEQRTESDLDALRLSWGKPMMMSVPSDSPDLLSRRIGDLIVRTTLRSDQKPASDVDEVRPGTEPMANSVIPELRLQREIDRLHFAD